MNNDELAKRAADIMMNDDPTLADWRALDDHDRINLVIDYRDDFASDEILADIPIMENLLHLIADELDSRL